MAAVQNCSGNDACWFWGSNGGVWGREAGGMRQAAAGRTCLRRRPAVHFIFAASASKQTLFGRSWNGCPTRSPAIDPMDYAGGPLNSRNRQQITIARAAAS